MRRWMPLLALSVVTACAGTSRLRGRIVDCQTQSPVEDAEVQLASPGTGASWSVVQTPSDGSFAFDVPRNSRDARLTLTAVKSGYRSAQKTYPSLPGAASDVCVAPILR